MLKAYGELPETAKIVEGDEYEGNEELTVEFQEGPGYLLSYRCGITINHRYCLSWTCP